MGGELGPVESIMRFFESLMAFDPGDIGKGLGELLDTVKTICLVVLGIVLLVLILWVLSHIFGGGHRG